MVGRVQRLCMLTVNVCVYGVIDTSPKRYTNKTCPAAKWYWRPLNSKRSIPVLKWTSKSELSFKNYIPFQSKSNHLTPCCACVARGNYW